MTHTVRVVAEPAVAAGFALAGVAADEVRRDGDVAAHLGALATRPEIGVLLVQQELLAALPAAEREAVERRPLPIVVPFAGPAWAATPTGAEAYVLDILQRAIGYRVRLR